MSQLANRLNNATLALAHSKDTPKEELTTEFFRALILFLPEHVSGGVSTIVNGNLSEIDISFRSK